MDFMMILIMIYGTIYEVGFFLIYGSPMPTAVLAFMGLVNVENSAFLRAPSAFNTGY
jgi:hypothetical protein